MSNNHLEMDMIGHESGTFWTGQELTDRDERTRRMALAAERESACKDLADALGLENPEPWSHMLGRVRARTQTLKESGDSVTIAIRPGDEEMARAITNGSLRDMYTAWRRAEGDWSASANLHDEPGGDQPATEPDEPQVDPDQLAAGIQALVVDTLNGWSDHRDSNRTIPAPSLCRALDRLHGAAIVLGWVELGES